jgi:hypothetical protein
MVRIESKSEALERRVNENFFDDDGRLIRIPARSDSKKLVVMRRLVQEFALGRQYPERDVNMLLARFHEDFATLRRMLVDYRFMSRANGIYRRIWVDAADIHRPPLRCVTSDG